MRSIIAGALLCASLACAGQAAPLQFTSFWVIGDSLSDPGNLSAATGGAIPGAPYVDGRFSNGPVWAEAVAARFAAKGRPTGNFAFGGAAVGPVPFRPFGAPPTVDLAGQVERFALDTEGLRGHSPVVSFMIGANDQFFAGIPLGIAAAVGTAAANGVADAALALRPLGVEAVMLANLPALDKTPAYTTLGQPGADQAALGTAAFNATLATRAAGLRDAGMTVIELDLFGLFNEVLADPGAFGLLNASLPCYVPGVFTCDIPIEAPLLAFFDAVHPSSTVHAELARRVQAEIAPVPLPATGLLLIAGLGALVLRARGSRRSS